MIDSHFANNNKEQNQRFSEAHVAHFINRKIVLTLDSAHMGGIETHVLTLAKYLQEQQYQIEIWFIKKYNHNPLYQLLNEAQIQYQFSDSTRDYCRKIKQERDKIILHTHGYKAGTLTRIMATLYSIPVISTFHSGDLGSGKLRLYSQLDLWTARLGTCIAVSEIIKGWLPKNAQLIPNFVQVSEVDKPRTVTSSKRSQQVAFVGRVSHEKGPDLFCQMAQLWSQSKLQDNPASADNPVTFVLYGDGPQRSELMEHYAQYVQFKGHVNMQEHWHNVDALCISSRFEGLPYVALEAMSLGIPVITFDVGGLKNLIDDPKLSWVVKAGDIQALTNAIQDWYQQTDEQKEHQSLLVKHKIHQHYSTDALIPKIEKLYKSAVDEL